ncbi:venom allergen 3-like isoform X2 [Diabrotica virgifera virgifera]|uniref:Venom allergen 3-like isoform X2 n=1 Tax=Diabrotica virgifera virgifera TaxID=50390 RepID=A0A6P7GI67_DIAVI|nr:venom allergen 3-like isoform X2 [Diabrotica virgifera virgifera]
MTKLNKMFRFIMLLRIVYSVVAVDYCSLCDNGSHTLCLYPKDGPGPNCLEYKKVSLSSDEKQYIVDLHNDIRNFVASGETKGKLGVLPPAANMMPLEWDEELAIIAQRWVDQCIPLNASRQHDLCRQTSRYKYVGQNVASSLVNKDEVTEFDIFILKWHQAAENVIPSDIKSFEGLYRGRKVIGHYSQMIWANSRAIGCGIAIYKAKLGDFYQEKFICNYGPGGNVAGQPIYIKGKPCSKCPNHKCDSSLNNLCQSGLLSNNIEEKNDFHLRSRNRLTYNLPKDGDECVCWFD